MKINMVPADLRTSQLHRFLKKHYIEDNHKFERIMTQLPNADRVMGALPYAWLEGIDKSEYPKLTRAIGMMFSKFATDIQRVYKALDKHETHNFIYMTNIEVNRMAKGFFKSQVENPIRQKAIEERDIMRCKRLRVIDPYKQHVDFLQRFLSKFLKKDVIVNELGEGHVKKAYKIDVNGNSSVLSTFAFDVQNDQYYTKHGKGSEIVRGIFADRHTPHNAYAKIYLAKATTHNDTDGFILSRFIDKNNCRKSNYQDHAEIFQPIYTIDPSSHNIIGNTRIEYGATLANIELLSKEKVKFSRMLQSAFTNKDIKKFDEIFEQNKDNKEFQELLKSLKKQINIKLLDSLRIDTDDKSLYMYKKLGLRIHPDDLSKFEDPIIEKIKTIGLTDPNQTIRIDFSFDRNWKRIFE